MAATRLIMLGPPGAGKGTQAQKLCKDAGLAHMSTGDMLRAAVAAKTPVGLQAKGYMEGGKLVPDEVVIGVLVEAIDKAVAAGAKGFVLDGFPRTLPQADALKKALSDRKLPIEQVILINTPDKVVQERLGQRRSCSDPKCGAVYNLASKPPKKDGVCDVCGKPVVLRNDDKPETVLVRQQTYWRDTAPLIDYYKKAGLLVEVPGSGSMDEIAGLVKDAVNKGGKKSGGCCCGGH
ncbi:MAG TPA: adenylate kinase [Planctomycetota bacterium]|jgi:adenylate kinase